MMGVVAPDDLAVSWARSLTARNLSPNTISSYLLCVRLLVEFCAAEDLETDPAKMTRSEVEKFIGHSLATRSVSTAGVRYRSLVQFFNWLVAEEEAQTHPMSAMSAPLAAEVPIPVVDDESLRRLLRAAEGKGFAARRDTAIIRLFIDTPCRLAEITYLDLCDIDWKASTITVRAKGSKVLVEPFGPQTAAALDRYVRVRRGHRYSRSTALWLGPRGPMTRWGLPQMLERRCHEAGIAKLHFHQFRHTFAHQWLKDGESGEDLMRLAGWSSRSMLNRYGAQLADERARDAYRRRLPGERV
jgi:site-specific recombinase XerD